MFFCNILLIILSNYFNVDNEQKERPTTVPLKACVAYEKWLLQAKLIPMGENNTVVSAYTMYRHLQQYWPHPSIHRLCKPFFLFTFSDIVVTPHKVTTFFFSLFRIKRIIL